MRRSLLDGVAQEPFAIRGVAAKAPLFYRDLHMMGGVFLADLAAARRLLPDGLEALSPLPGRALLGVNCFEYRDTDIGPYNEVALSIAVHRAHPRLPGAVPSLLAALRERFHLHVVQLPVNTEIALWGGLDVFGFPKYLADIRFEERGGERTCRVLDRATGELIFAVTGRSLRAAPPWPRSGVLTSTSYPTLDGRPLQATVRIGPRERATRLLGDHLRLGFGGSARARQIEELRPGRLLEYFWVPRAEAILYRPAPDEQRARRG